MPGNDIRGAAEQILRRPLEPIEQLILEHSWAGRTYSEIAQTSGYASVYVREVGSRLWQALSEALGARVTKKNLQLLLNADQVAQANAPEFPSGPLGVNSHLYIERPPLEQKAAKAIRQPGCLLRIRATRKMGQTSLLYRLMGEAKKFGYQTIMLNLQQVEPVIFETGETFLRWFCATISYQLELAEDPLHLPWDAGMGSSLNCTFYLQREILEVCRNPIVLVIQGLDVLLRHAHIAWEFLPLLRGWHEEAQRLESWQKLRVVVTHAIDLSSSSALALSSLMAGLELQLPELTLPQVQQLSQRYGVDWSQGNQAERLMALIGGHPYLMAIALYHMATEAMMIEEILQQAELSNGLYGTHLRAYWSFIQTHPHLAPAIQAVVRAEGAGVPLEGEAADALESVGLIKIQGGLAYAACPLYQRFFANLLQQTQPPRTSPNALSPDVLSLIERLEKRVEYLEEQVQGLQRSHQLDPTTQVMNRAAFEGVLEQAWQAAQPSRQAIALLLCGIDFFHVYVEAHGQVQGEACRQQVAQTIQAIVQDRGAGCVGLNSTEQFWVLLTDSTIDQALVLAHQIREQVEALDIRHPSNYLGWPAQVITVSIGVVSTTPQPEQERMSILQKAEQAFSQAQRQGHNCVKLVNY